jgi:acetyltransferase
MGALRGMSFSKVISIGNESDLGSSDFIDYLGEDEKTAIIMSYLEGSRDGRGLLRALLKTSLRKPVIIWKAGTTSAGAQAVASHTGSLAGADAVWDSALRQTGAIRAGNVEEMVDIATAFYYIPAAMGKRMAIVSGPDGPTLATAKLLELHGLRVAQLTGRSVDMLRKIIPQYGANSQGRVDLGITAWDNPSLYPEVLKVLDTDPNVDVMLVIGGGISPDGRQAYMELMVDVKRQIRKPCMLISISAATGDLEVARKLQGAGYPLYTTPERAISAYSKLVGYYGRRKGR